MNSNAKFTGFSPEELAAAEAETATISAYESSKSIEEIEAELGIEKSPENGQIDPIVEECAVKLTEKLAKEVNKTITGETPYDNLPSAPVKKHKKKKSWTGGEFGGLVSKSLGNKQVYYYDKPIPDLKASPFDPANSYHFDNTKQDDVIGSPSESWPDPKPYLSKEDIQKAKQLLMAKSFKPYPGSFIPVSTAPNTATSTVTTPYSTYIMGKDAIFGSADWGSANYQLDALQKEASYWKSQTEEAKEIIKQLSGEPGEFIYIHPFDLYELLNSFVIPVSLNVDQDMKDIGYIEINGKKYKQSTLMPIISKNDVVDATKYNKAEQPMTKFEKEYPW